ncbi:MAG: HAMP domain-containing histidine kinase [Hymenobacteraceae bacterium]|nr:HAMP domain-containing histidine kinase [Hymenobacteraceae bacterium]
MINRIWERVGVKVLALVAVLLALAWFAVQRQPTYVLALLPVVIGIGYSLYAQQRRLLKEVRQFAEAIRYRDFSRYFTTHQTPPDLKAVRQDFNEIIGTFKAISRERETQYHYLQNVLELVDTGIFSYEIATGEVLWVNETLKQQLLLPYIKSLAGLARRYPELVARLDALQPGERQVIGVQPEKATIQLLFSATVFQADSKQYKLVACQNISEALDESEGRAWQRLLSVMTHEIMNSVAPISSLADTLQSRLEEAAGHFGPSAGLPNRLTPAPAAGNPTDDSTDGLLEDLRLGIETIKRRSAGLLKFASTYRSLSKVTIPDRRPVLLRDLFDSLHRLMQPTLHGKGITLDILLADPTLTVEADPSLLEQVLINLLVNAIDAVKAVAEPRITLAAALSPERRILLKLRDNGEGITPDVLQNIFVPFFTTKKSGSGIGLSLCKQIMLLHRGSIQVHSEPGHGTVFTLVF